MVKKKLNRSLFSAIVEQIDPESLSAEYHRVDNEYFAAFNSLDSVEKFHNQISEKRTMIAEQEPAANASEEDDDDEMDMKSFAQQFLIDTPEADQARKENATTSVNTNVDMRRQRRRRNIRDLPQSSNFIFMSDDDGDEEPGNIFDSLKEKRSSHRSNRIAYEDMSSILLTLDVIQKKSKKNLASSDSQEPTIAIELAEPSMIKSEPTEPEHLIISHVIEAKEEPVELNVIPTVPMGFGTPDYSGRLDNYVQNIHRACSTNVSISDSVSSRPKRIRKRKRLYIEESEAAVKPKRLRKKRAQMNPPSTLLTDAEIEQQFGERLSPTVKSECNDESRTDVLELEPIFQTPIEKARAKLKNALERGRAPDTFLLKIRSRESKMIEVELAIYSTADWHAHRAKVLAKIEEALRGLRVSWTKIDIRVDDYDVQICTSPQAALATPPVTISNSNSSWFLKALSECGPLIVHIHDRRYPHQRHLTKCICSQCSSNNLTPETSLPVIVSVSPAKTSPHRLSSPSILRKCPSSFNSLISAFPTVPAADFKQLAQQHDINTVNSIAQCLLDLTLIVSVHTALAYLQSSTEDYQSRYQHVLDPMRSPKKNSANVTVSKYFIGPDILAFEKIIKQSKANIRNAHSMRSVIFQSIPRTPLSKMIKTTTVILPKHRTTGRPLILNRSHRRHRNSASTSETTTNNNGAKQQAHFTPIIELKPILGGSTHTDEEPIRKVTKIISTNTIQKDAQRINTITTQEIAPRVIRLSITKTSPSSSTIHLVPSQSSMNHIESSPLIPKQINIIKPLNSSSITPAVKLVNPVLISNRSQQPLIK
ncbi:unnamed protein product [Adineta ricciae]|uniref:Uncharacterized protein n=1 Tax=Adineta ricciae TaxID=249248 RepID=A0A815Z714_ADIRI|nr:unnamed protein product [Adineta ricciae]